MAASQTGWLSPTELRVGLGCMRLPVEDGGEVATSTIGAAADAGITVFDTARAYEGNERLLARALRARGGAGRARIVTKGGMTRPGGAWVPDGRAKAIRADCEASLDALDGLPIDLYLLHAPDPRTPWATSVRALARLVDVGLVVRVGVCNVDRRRLDEALELAPIAAVQAALSPYDDRVLRSGVLDRCTDLGIALLAHTPLGGPKRAARVGRRHGLAAVAEANRMTSAEAALAWVLARSPVVVAIPGARRPETARSAARAASLALEQSSPEPRRRPPRRSTDAEVVLVMGIPGAGKSRVAAGYVDRGFVRLNRDERGGSLRQLAEVLGEELAGGATRVVLDNTYLTRASRRDVIDAAARHGADVRCLWLDTPPAQAQVNLVGRLLDRTGALPRPDELRTLARREAGVLAPTSFLRAVRELEPPAEDEGFARIEVVPFARAAGGGVPGVLVAAAAAVGSPDPDAPHLVFDWHPDGDRTRVDAAAERLEAVVGGPVEATLCSHPGGPPTCWCRPPLPGLPLAWARTQGVDLARSVLVGSKPAHHALATAVGARYATAT